MSDKTRIIELQRCLRIARQALERIKGGQSDPAAAADQALYEMMPLEPKQPLQGICGHARRGV